MNLFGVREPNFQGNKRLAYRAAEGVSIISRINFALATTELID